MFARKVLYAREILLTPLPLYDNITQTIHIRNTSCTPRTFAGRAWCRVWYTYIRAIASVFVGLCPVLLLLFKVVELCAVVLTYIIPENVYQFIYGHVHNIKFKYYIHI